MNTTNTNRFVGLAFSVACTFFAPLSEAFCGFFVSGADRTLYNDATFVVMARAGDQTILSMQNSYQGPPEDFAMVVPVPVVLRQDDVKTLPDDVFDRVDRLTAPRLVEYWEQNPCAGAKRPELSWAMSRPDDRNKELSPQARVVVEAEFTVGEYEIVILSAGDSTALDSWLRDNKYKIPAGAEPVLRPYVTNGSKFFVAKVNTSKVRFHEGRAVLSPLRFQYSSPDFSLPVRLGLLNSSGVQDLIAIVLGSNRYEAANYKNVFMPTNVEVDDSVRNRFGEFYTGLFDRVLAKTPGAIVTEYAWEPGSCDPCPEPPLSDMDLKRLTGDLVPLWGSVITRLHYRYDKNSLGEDLVLRSAPPMSGGRGVWEEEGLSQKAETAPMDAFQTRFIIRHPWSGAVTCADPKRNEWGGPPEGLAVPEPAAATELATINRKAVDAATLLRVDVPELDLHAPVISAPEKQGTFRRGLSIGAMVGIVVTLLEILRRRFQKA
jgi:hypothetical protein